MAKSRIGIIDYGMGNLHSASKALEHVAGDGTEVVVSSDPDVIRRTDRVLLPGVGAIRDCMAEIRRLGFDQLVLEVANEKPLLAICVGIQALMESSEENDGVACLGFFAGQARYFGNDLVENGDRLKVPHMGWNPVQQKMRHPLWQGVPDGSRFYFVHSYYVEPGVSEDVAGETRYGLPFAAALARGNVFATQFHPEKSHRAGLQLLENFVTWDGES